MAAPVLTVPQGGPIAARPRKEHLYDSEVITAAGATTVFPFFQNTRQFADPVAAFAKVRGLDTNLVGNGGSIPRGHYLRVFGWNFFATRRQVQAVTSAAIVEKIKVWDMGWGRILLGSTPYLDTPMHRVCGGTGLSGAVGSNEGAAITAGDLNMGWPICTAYFDLTVPGKVRKATAKGVKEMKIPRIPIEFAETESFTIEVNYPVRPAPVGGNIFITARLVSIYLKPLSS